MDATCRTHPRTPRGPSGPATQRPGVWRYSPRWLFALALCLCLWPALAQATAGAQTPGADAVPSAPAEFVPFRWSGEELYYSFRFNGAEAMRAALRTGKPRTNSLGTYIPLAAFAQSVGLFHRLYPLEDRASTYLDAQRLVPMRSEKDFREKGEKRLYEVDYAHEEFEARVERAHQDNLRRFRTPILPNTHDMLSWLYHLRANTDLRVGQQTSFYVYDGWLVSHITIKVVAREDVLTPMGWFKTWRVDFVRDIVTTHVAVENAAHRATAPTTPAVRVKEAARHSGSFWLTRDENRLPVRVRVNTMFGDGEGVLVRFKHGAAPE